MKRIKQFFSECQLRIDTFFDRLCDRVTEHVERKEMEQRSFREFVLEDETKNVKLDNKYLQLQLTKTRADLYELQRRPQELRGVISGIFLMTNEKLREISRFPIRKSESGEV